MSAIATLWLPTLVAAVAVFIVSAIVHMVVNWHRNDQAPVPNEDAVADTLRGLPPGEYRLPWAGTREEMHSAAFLEKVKRGPMAIVGIWGSSDMKKGFQKALGLWFGYCLVASFIAGHVAYAALARATDGHDVFHATALTAFAGYGLGVAQASIWGPRPWGPTIKNMVDGVIYALVTGFAFAWLWPK